MTVADVVAVRVGVVDVVAVIDGVGEGDGLINPYTVLSYPPKYRSRDVPIAGEEDIQFPVLNFHNSVTVPPALDTAYKYE